MLSNYFGVLSVVVRQPVQVAETEAGGDRYELNVPPEQVNSYRNRHLNDVV
jgi:ribosome maturation protein Sdo1